MLAGHYYAYVKYYEDWFICDDCKVLEWFYVRRTQHLHVHVY